MKKKLTFIFNWSILNKAKINSNYRKRIFLPFHITSISLFYIISSIEYIVNICMYYRNNLSLSKTFTEEAAYIVVVA